LWLEKYEQQWIARIDNFEKYVNKLKANKMSNKNDATNRTLTLKKVIDAPVKLVWEAWTNSDHIMQWVGSSRYANKYGDARL
jgi:hypothetical protein